MRLEVIYHLCFAPVSNVENRGSFREARWYCPSSSQSSYGSSLMISASCLCEIVELSRAQDVVQILKRKNSPDSLSTLSGWSTVIELGQSPIGGLHGVCPGCHAGDGRNDQRVKNASWRWDTDTNDISITTTSTTPTTTRHIDCPTRLLLSSSYFCFMVA